MQRSSSNLEIARVPVAFGVRLMRSRYFTFTWHAGSLFQLRNHALQDGLLLSQLTDDAVA